MKILSTIFKPVFLVLFTSADPNLFGSRKRRKEKEALSKEFKGYASDYESEIDKIKSANPFESASAKSAMAQATRGAKQMQSRFANILGGNATPESIIAAQGQTQEALAGAAGNIATGAEAMKKQELSELRGLKSATLGQAAGIKQSAINERGSGWNSFFNTMFNPLVGAASGAAETLL